MINGSTCSIDNEIPRYDNVKVIKRLNTGFDFGGWANGLRAYGIDTDPSATASTPAPAPAPATATASTSTTTIAAPYKYFVFVNTSVRGPLLPSCGPPSHRWFDAFTSLLKNDVHLSGISINALELRGESSGLGRKPHVQSMLMATDQTGLRAMLAAGIFHDNDADLTKEMAIARREIGASAAIFGAGGEIDCLLPGQRGRRYSATKSFKSMAKDDVWLPGGWGSGSDVDPLDVVFFKSNRGVTPAILAKKTAIADLELIHAPHECVFDAPGRRTIEWLLTPPAPPTAWAGHLHFAAWLVARLRPRLVLDLGVDYGHSTFALGLSGVGQIIGVDWFAGDAHAGYRDTWTHVHQAGAQLRKDFGRRDNIRFVRGDFHEVALQPRFAGPDVPNQVDILHLDGLHTYKAVSADLNSWLPRISAHAVVLFHDICSFPLGPGRLFAELPWHKLAMTHSAGLGVACREKSVIDMIRKEWVDQLEPFVGNPLFFRHKDHDVLIRRDDHLSRPNDDNSHQLPASFQLSTYMASLPVGSTDPVVALCALPYEFYRNSLIAKNLVVEPVTQPRLVSATKDVENCRSSGSNSEGDTDDEKDEKDEKNENDEKEKKGKKEKKEKKCNFVAKKSRFENSRNSKKGWKIDLTHPTPPKETNHLRGSGTITVIGANDNTENGPKITINRRVVAGPDVVILFDDPQPVLKNESQNVTIGNDVKLGAGCRILSGTKIPDGVELKPCTVVGPSTPMMNPYAVMEGNPAKLVRQKYSFDKGLLCDELVAAQWWDRTESELVLAGGTDAFTKTCPRAGCLALKKNPLLEELIELGRAEKAVLHRTANPTWALAFERNYEQIKKWLAAAGVECVDAPPGPAAQLGGMRGSGMLHVFVFAAIEGPDATPALVFQFEQSFNERWVAHDMPGIAVLDMSCQSIKKARDAGSVVDRRPFPATFCAPLSRFFDGAPLVLDNNRESLVECGSLDLQNVKENDECDKIVESGEDVGNIESAENAENAEKVKEEKEEKEGKEEKEEKEQKEQKEQKEEKDIEVLFVGTSSGRRLKALNDIRATGVNLCALHGVMDWESYVKRSKVLVNIHVWNADQGLELHRISQFPMSGAVILSESSPSDPWLTDWLGDAIMFAPLADLPALALRLARDDEYRSKVLDAQKAAWLRLYSHVDSYLVSILAN